MHNISELRRFWIVSAELWQDQKVMTKHFGSYPKRYSTTFYVTHTHHTYSRCHSTVLNFLHILTNTHSNDFECGFSAHFYRLHASFLVMLDVSFFLYSPVPLNCKSIQFSSKLRLEIDGVTYGNASPVNCEVICFDPYIG